MFERLKLLIVAAVFLCSSHEVFASEPAEGFFTLGKVWNYAAVEQDSKIYRVNDDKMSLIMDFGLELGDRLDEFSGVVVAIDSIDVKGYKRKRLTFDYDGIIYYAVEGVGMSSDAYLGEYLNSFYNELESVYENGICIFEASDFNTTEYKPLVEKGKTWWYEIQYVFTQDDEKYHEFGLRIGDEVEINGVKWHKCVFVDKNLSELEQPVGYVREADKRVYYYGAPKEAFSELPTQMIDPFRYDSDFGEHIECLIYDFNLQVGDTYSIPYSEIESGYNIDEIVYEENSSRQYKVFVNKDIAFGEVIYEGIGGYCEQSTLFFCPFELYAADMHYRPELRWVTDADNKVIFEGKGGTKIWETDSNYDIELDKAITVERYYDLTGRQVKNPINGVYIVRLYDGRIHKVVL